MPKVLVQHLLYLFVALSIANTAVAQSIQDRIEQTNKGTVGIISGGINGTYIRIASDLADVLDDGDDLRVLAIRGKGSLQNINDILYLKGIDIGIVQSDVLEFSKRENLQHPNISDRINYVTKLYNEEIHILAREGFRTLQDLAGAKVNFGIQGSGTEMTASIVFETLGVAVERTSFDQGLAFEKLKAGDIDAQVYVAGKPTRLFQGASAEDELHFIPIEFTPELLETYFPSTLTAADYPGLIEEGGQVNTLAIGAMMAVYNWPEGTDRYYKVQGFMRCMFRRCDEFQTPPRHPKWREVSLSTDLAGWTRFPPAAEWLNTQ